MIVLASVGETTGGVVTSEVSGNVAVPVDKMLEMMSPKPVELAPVLSGSGVAVTDGVTTGIDPVPSGMGVEVGTMSDDNDPRAEVMDSRTDVTGPRIPEDESSEAAGLVVAGSVVTGSDDAGTVAAEVGKLDGVSVS